MICACLLLAYIYALAGHVRVLSGETGLGGDRMYTPTYSGHTQSMSTTINSVIATTFKQLLPVCICNSTGSSEIS